jgi:beta-lactamase regulating signal transducer with metallopeptidase domain
VTVVIALLFDVAVKVSVLLLLVLAAATGLRRASAATRHFLWTAALSAALVLPLLSLAIPWRLTVPVPRNVGVEWLALPGGEPAGARPSPPIGGRPLAPDATPVRVESPVGETGASEQLFPVRQIIRNVGLLPILGAAWLAGALAVLLRMALGWAVVERVKRRGTSLLVNDGWRAGLESVARRLGVGRPVRLVSHQRTRIPFTTGLFPPVIVLPAEAESWTADRRAAVLLHEMAHLRRADLVPHLIAQVATALYWFNPLVWMAGRRLRAESERACDDLVLGLGTRPSQYARHLLEIVAGAGRSFSPAIAMPMAQRSDFEGRVLAILEAGASRHGRTRPMIVAVALVVVLAAVILASLTPAGRDAVQAAPTWLSLRPTGALIRALEAPQAGARRVAAQVLGEREDAVAVGPLMRVVEQDDDPEVRGAAARALGEIEDPTAMDALARAIRDSHNTVRYEAARAIGKIGLPVAPPALIDALQDGDPGVRRAAVRALGEFEDPNLVPPLSPLIRDPDPKVRRAAVRALADTETPAAYEVLRAALMDEDADIRRLAAKALDEERE